MAGGISLALELSPRQFKYWVELQRQLPTSNDVTGVPPQWVRVFRARAAIFAKVGSEVDDAIQVLPVQNHDIYLRWTRRRVGPEMRVVYEGRIFEISAVVNMDERNRYWHLRCVEVNNPQKH